jgi:acetyltransferase-like isoleucine patch superfamily enzyme
LIELQQREVLMSFFVHESAVVEPGATVGEGSKIWHWAHVRTGVNIGEACVIGKGVFIDADVTVGGNCKLQNNVSVYSGVTIGEGVFVGPHVCFTNDKLPRAVGPDGAGLSATEWSKSETTVLDGASIGANATILCGVTLGQWCMIGAGAVVTHTVPPYALVLGNPARVSGVVAPSGEILSSDYREGDYHSSTGEKVSIDKQWCISAGL